jgi:hypothetical protein
MTIYIKIRHYLFWYGQYRLCGKSCSDEFWVYADRKEQTELAYFDVNTKGNLEYWISPEGAAELDDPKWVAELKDFYNSDDQLHYMFLYPENEQEFSFSDLLVPRNEKGLYPDYIYVYTKRDDGWDIDSISECAKNLVELFLKIDVDHVEMLDIPTYEETKISFLEDCADGAKF